MSTVDIDAWAAWRQTRHAALTAPTGNLALIETVWLDDGEGAGETPDGLETTLLERTDPATGTVRHGIRRWDANSPAVRHFVGTNPYPYDPAWVIPGRFVAAGAEHRVAFEHKQDNGATRDLPVPGHIDVTIQGLPYRVHAFDDEGTLLLVFGDRTNGSQTYGGGRFLIVDWPTDGQVRLDFNRAYTPPCGFSAAYNCPLPPPENRFPFPIEAGERRPVFRDGFELH